MLKIDTLGILLSYFYGGMPPFYSRRSSDYISTSNWCLKIRFQRQPRVTQVVIGHHGVVADFLNTKYCHGIMFFLRPGKVSIFGEKAASTLPGHPGGENLWAVASRLIVEEKIRDFRLLLKQFYI